MSVVILMSIIHLKSTDTHLAVCLGDGFLQPLHLRLGYHQQDSRCAAGEGRGV